MKATIKRAKIAFNLNKSYVRYQLWEAVWPFSVTALVMCCYIILRELFQVQRNGLIIYSSNVWNYSNIIIVVVYVSYFAHLIQERSRA